MKLYIISGFNENCSLKPYQELKKLAEAKGYKVVTYDIDFTKPLSKQLFKVKKEDAVFGFSVGALMARMVAEKTPCKKVILASSTPISGLFDLDYFCSLCDVLGYGFTNDLRKNILIKTPKNSITLYGDKENYLADIIVKDTGHRLNKNYLKEIEKLL